MSVNQHVSSLGRSWVVFKLLFRLLVDYWWYNLKGKFLPHQRSPRQRSLFYRQIAVRFREAAVTLGGLLVKLGQFFSTRVDLLPREFIEELAKLQDEVPAVAYPVIKAAVESDLGQPLEILFTDFEETAVASASLGQVHRATLPTGELVAVKVRRPRIEFLIASDLRSIKWFIVLLRMLTDWAKNFDLEALYDEFTQTITNELDYIKEGHNAERINASFGPDAGVVIPRVYWSHTTARVLTMEYIQGMKVTDYAALVAAEIDREAVARQLIAVYLKQILEHGFYHADPHPGNIFVLPSGHLAFVDFGMVGSVTENMKKNLGQLVRGLALRDNWMMIKAMRNLGFLRPHADMDVLAKGIELIVDNFFSRSSEGEYDYVGLAEEFREFIYSEPFQIPAKYMFLGRAAGTLYGLCIGLNPKINFVEELKPFLNYLSGDRSTKGLSGFIWEQVQDFATASVGLPRLWQRVLHKLENGDVRVKVSRGSLTQAIENHSRALDRLSLSIIFAAFLIVSILLYLHQLMDEAKLAFGITGLVGLFLLRAGRRARRWRAPHSMLEDLTRDR
ncbi:MAG: AarF/ABC1/UbiB kinase family protein [Firmicutes bacterium]|nr:AarF/ABC1/UbiB kinase family protein [Bacillota bacterium]